MGHVSVCVNLYRLPDCLEMRLVLTATIGPWHKWRGIFEISKMKWEIFLKMTKSWKVCYCVMSCDSYNLVTGVNFILKEGNGSISIYITRCCCNFLLLEWNSHLWLSCSYIVFTTWCQMMICLQLDPETYNISTDWPKVYLVPAWM